MVAAWWVRQVLRSDTRRIAERGWILSSVQSHISDIVGRDLGKEPLCACAPIKNPQQAYAFGVLKDTEMLNTAARSLNGYQNPKTASPSLRRFSCCAMIPVGSCEMLHTVHEQIIPLQTLGCRQEPTPASNPSDATDGASPSLSLSA